MSNTLSNVQASIFKFCSDFAASHELIFLNFDAHANDEVVPEGNITGPLGLALRFNENLIDVEVMFGIATDNDTNLFLLSKLMGELLELLRPGKTVKVYDSDTGATIGWMVVQNGTRLLPVSGTAAKPLQYIAVDFATNVSFKN